MDVKLLRFTILLLGGATTILTLIVFLLYIITQPPERFAYSPLTVMAFLSLVAVAFFSFGYAIYAEDYLVTRMRLHTLLLILTANIWYVILIYSLFSGYDPAVHLISLFSDCSPEKKMACRAESDCIYTNYGNFTGNVHYYEKCAYQRNFVPGDKKNFLCINNTCAIIK